MVSADNLSNCLALIACPDELFLFHLMFAIVCAVVPAVSLYLHLLCLYVYLLHAAVCRFVLLCLVLIHLALF